MKPEPVAEETFHKEALVTAILADRTSGMPLEAIRIKRRVSHYFLSAVISGEHKPCAHCGKPFYPNSDTGRWGDKDCYSAFIRGAGT